MWCPNCNSHTEVTESAIGARCRNCGSIASSTMAGPQNIQHAREILARWANADLTEQITSLPPLPPILSPAERASEDDSPAASSAKIKSDVDADEQASQENGDKQHDEQPTATPDLRTEDAVDSDSAAAAEDSEVTEHVGESADIVESKDPERDEEIVTAEVLTVEPGEEEQTATASVDAEAIDAESTREESTREESNGEKSPVEKRSSSKKVELRESDTAPQLTSDGDETEGNHDSKSETETAESGESTKPKVSHVRHSSRLFRRVIKEDPEQTTVRPALATVEETPENADPAASAEANADTTDSERQSVSPPKSVAAADDVAADALVEDSQSRHAPAELRAEVPSDSDDESRSATSGNPQAEFGPKLDFTKPVTAPAPPEQPEPASADKADSRRRSLQKRNEQRRRERNRKPSLSTENKGSEPVKKKFRVDTPGGESADITPADPESAQEPTNTAGARIQSNSPKGGRRHRIDGAQGLQQTLKTGDNRPRTSTPPRRRYIDEAHGPDVRGPHFEITAPKRSNLTSITGQMLAYVGVLGLTIGTAMVIYGHFGGHAEYTPTGWLVTTVAQMMLFLGVINLVSGGIEQNNVDVSARINHLGEQLMRIEQVTEEAIRGPRIDPRRYMDSDAAHDESKETVGSYTQA